jgi:hypothetical protein
VDGYEITTSQPGWSFSDNDTHGGIAPGIATLAELDFSQTEARELTRVDIQIRSRYHGEFSAFSPAVACVLPVLAPGLVETAIEPDGIAVAWSSRSNVATTIDVERAPLDAAGAPGSWSLVATLPAQPPTGFSQTQLDTAAAATTTAYGYRVSAVAPGGQRGISDVATVLARGAPLSVSTVTLPPADVTITDGKGHYALFDSPLASGPLQLRWGDGTTWTSAPAITASVYEPFVRLDAAGLPHTVYGKPGPGLDVMITHGWFDGTQWNEELIAERRLVSISDAAALIFDLDANATPVIMWTTGDGLGHRQFEAAAKVDGAWVVQLVDALVPPALGGPSTVFSDASGVPHVLISSTGSLWHLQLRDGAWTAEPLPPDASVLNGPMLGAGHDPDHLAVCFDDLFSFSFLGSTSCVRRTPAGWGPVEQLGSLPGRFGDFDVGSIAMSADGQRLAVMHQGVGSQLFRSDRAGAWTENAFPTVAPGGFEPVSFLGFDASGKLFLLVDPRNGNDQAEAVVAYRLSKEP